MKSPVEQRGQSSEEATPIRCKCPCKKSYYVMILKLQCALENLEEWVLKEDFSSFAYGLHN